MTAKKKKPKDEMPTGTRNESGAEICPYTGSKDVGPGSTPGTSYSRTAQRHFKTPKPNQPKPAPEKQATQETDAGA